MKSVKNFSKAFLGCAIASCVVIVFGIVGFFVRGINFGIDFEPGLIEEIRVAPSAIELSYQGPATVSVEAGNTAVSLIISGTGAENETVTFTYGQNPTVKDLAAALDSVDGVSAKVTSNPDADTYGIFVNSAASSRLSSDSVYRIYVASAESAATIDQVRAALDGQNVQIKALGKAEDSNFQIRSKIANDDSTNAELTAGILNALYGAFGAENVAIVKTDFVGSSFSSSLAVKSIILALATVLLIWLYATIRFHWDFALGSIIALFHDCLIMFAFISWAQIEFSTTTLAAVLTIFGYSINATVVILDRIRSNIKLVQTKSFNDILNKSLSDTLTRSILTTVTTLFASISLLIFTTGSIRDFAIVLTVGLISGCYSSIFISSGLISVIRRNWKPEYAQHVNAPKAKPEMSVVE